MAVSEWQIPFLSLKIRPFKLSIRPRDDGVADEDVGPHRYFKTNHTGYNLICIWNHVTFPCPTPSVADLANQELLNETLQIRKPMIQLECAIYGSPSSISFNPTAM